MIYYTKHFLKLNMSIAHKNKLNKYKYNWVEPFFHYVSRNNEVAQEN
jgi:hypothetical protein